MAEVVEVPLRRRDGSVKAVAIIDGSDWPAVSQHRWYLSDEYPQAYIRGLGRKMRLHRFLMGEPPQSGLMVDHRNQNPLDNRRCNLRWTTNAGNKQNGRAHRDSTSAHRGVSWSSRRQTWVAQAAPNGRCRFLGHFAREEDAAEAVRRFWAAIEKENS